MMPIVLESEQPVLDLICHQNTTPCDQDRSAVLGHGCLAVPFSAAFGVRRVTCSDFRHGDPPVPTGFESVAHGFAATDRLCRRADVRVRPCPLPRLQYLDIPAAPRPAQRAESGRIRGLHHLERPDGRARRCRTIPGWPAGGLRMPAIECL